MLVIWDDLTFSNLSANLQICATTILGYRSQPDKSKFGGLLLA